MTSEYIFLEILKEELLDRFATINPTINKHKVLGKPDFREMSAILLISERDRYSSGNKSESGVLEKFGDTNFKVSPEVFGRLYKWGYKLSKDRRSVNTLNVLGAFVGYKDWQDFVEKKQEQFKIGVGIFEKVLVGIVEKANDIEFKAYQQLPEISVEDFKDYFVLTGGAFMRIYNVLVQHSKKKWTISNEGNPSHHYAHRVWVERVYQNKATVKTEEDWYLRWFDLSIKKYVAIYNEPNVQTWTLEFVDERWKVVNTEYPPPKNFVRITHVLIVSISKSILRFIKRSI